MNIIYSQEVSSLTTNQLEGFFVGWKNKPSEATLKKILENSEEALVAIDTNTNQVVGFITAITDGVLSAYIPFLEVVPAYHKQGIGQELTKRMLEALKPYYMVDIVCDEHLVPFYEKAGLKRSVAMIRRNYEQQSGRGTI